MNEERAFQVALIAGFALFVPCAAYFRVRAHATGESLDRRQEGWPILLTLRPAGFLYLFLLLLYVGILRFFGAAALMGIGTTLAAASWLMAVVFVAFFSLIVLHTRIEEQKLLDRFGDAYRVYMERTGRFWP